MPEWTPRNARRARELRNSATPAERLLWRYLARSQLGAKFSRQMQVGPFFTDFLCRERRLVVELDGMSHDRQPERDAGRDRWLAREGYRTLRFTNEDVLRDPEAVATAIRQEIERLAAPTPTPPASGRGASSAMSPLPSAGGGRGVGASNPDLGAIPPNPAQVQVK